MTKYVAVSDKGEFVTITIEVTAPQGVVTAPKSPEPQHRIKWDAGAIEGLCSCGAAAYKCAKCGKVYCEEFNGKANDKGLCPKCVKNG